MGKLDGRVAIVTGASRGIGAEIARLYASEGAKVCCPAGRDGRALVAALPILTQNLAACLNCLVFLPCAAGRRRSPHARRGGP